MTVFPEVTSLHTVADLKAALERAGMNADSVAYAGDPDSPKLDGMTLFRWLAPARWETVVWERGNEYFAEEFESEQRAVQAFARTTFKPVDVIPRSPEQATKDREKMRIRKEEGLQRIREQERRKRGL